MKKSYTAVCVILAAILCAILIFGLLNQDHKLKSLSEFNYVGNEYSELNYIALGDSITFGHDPANWGNQMDHPYPHIVQRLLKLKSHINYGIGATKLAERWPNDLSMSVRYASMTDDADIVSVLGGVNDFRESYPLGAITDTTNNTIYGALNTLAKGLKEKYPDAFVFFMTPYPCIHNDKACTENNSAGYNLEAVVNAIKEVCEIYSYPVLDLYNLGMFAEVEMNSPSSDHLHPSQEFIDMYTAPQIARFIIENYKFN